MERGKSGRLIPVRPPSAFHVDQQTVPFLQTGMENRSLFVGPCKIALPNRFFSTDFLRGTENCVRPLD